MKGIVYCPVCESENIDECDRLDFQIGTKYICNDCGYTFWDDEVSIKLKENGEVDDGDHTFNELYYHRMVLFSIICNQNKDIAWKSWKHEDGTMYEDYFIVGIETPEGQYSYHYHKDYWDEFKVKELSNAPKYDGHKPSDITRLKSILRG